MSTYIRLESPRVKEAVAGAYNDLKNNGANYTDSFATRKRLEQISRATEFQTEIWVTLDDLQLFQDFLKRIDKSAYYNGQR